VSTHSHCLWGTVSSGEKETHSEILHGLHKNSRSSISTRKGGRAFPRRAKVKTAKTGESRTKGSEVEPTTL